MKNALPVTLPVRAREMTDANMGPTQGVHISPKLKPTRIPLRNPSPPGLGTREIRELMPFSMMTCVCGINMVRPKAKITITEIVRRLSGETPNALTIAVRKSVKKVNPIMNPSTIPHGLFLPPATEPERTIGRMGKMQGERIVTNPPIKAKRRSSATLFYVIDYIVYAAAVPFGNRVAVCVNLHK